MSINTGIYRSKDDVVNIESIRIIVHFKSFLQHNECYIALNKAAQQAPLTHRSILHSLFVFACKL